MVKPGLYNSLFYVLGKCYDWNLYQIADLYGTSLNVIKLWLYDLGFSSETIDGLEKRGPYELDKCVYCGMLSQSVYCSDECEQAHINQKASVEKMIHTGRVPIIGWRNIYWDINKGKIIRENCLR